MVGTAVLGAPRFSIFLWKNAVFSRVLAENRGAPKTAVPTTTHPIPHLTPASLGEKVPNQEAPKSSGAEIKALAVDQNCGLGTHC